MARSTITKREAYMRQRAALGKATADELRALESDYGVDVSIYQTKPKKVPLAPSPATPTEAPPIHEAPIE